MKKGFFLTFVLVAVMMNSAQADILQDADMVVRNAERLVRESQAIVPSQKPVIEKSPVTTSQPRAATAPVSSPALTKPQQPPQSSAPPPIQAAKNATGNIPYGLQMPPLEADVPYNGITYKKNEVLYMVGWITPDGRTVDETGNPIKDTILTRVRPQGAIIEVYQKPSNRQ